MHAKLLQSCWTHCNRMVSSPPGPSVYGILQGRILEWVAMFSSRGSSQPRDQTFISYVSCIGRWVLYHKCHLSTLFSSAIIVIFSCCSLPQLECKLYEGYNFVDYIHFCISRAWHSACLPESMQLLDKYLLNKWTKVLTHGSCWI